MRGRAGEGRALAGTRLQTRAKLLLLACLTVDEGQPVRLESSQSERGDASRNAVNWRDFPCCFTLRRQQRNVDVETEAMIKTRFGLVW